MTGQKESPVAEPLGYVVVTWNQASGQPDLETCGMHSEPGGAIAERGELRAETARSGRGERHEVCAVIPWNADDA